MWHLLLVWPLPLSAKVEESVTTGPTHWAGTKAHLDDLMVPSGRVVVQRIKFTLRITGWSSLRAHINGKLWQLNVNSSPPGTVVCSKGWSIRLLKRYMCWVHETVLIRNQQAFPYIFLKKNQHNTPGWLEFRKFYPYYYKYSYREIL